MGLTDRQRRAIRRIIHGNPDRPAVLQTGTTYEDSDVPAGMIDPPHKQGTGMHPNGQAPQPPQLQVDPVAVLEEIRRIDPRVVDLAMERVARKQISDELAQVRAHADQLQQALTEYTVDRNESVETGEPQ